MSVLTPSILHVLMIIVFVLPPHLASLSDRSAEGSRHLRTALETSAARFTWCHSESGLCLALIKSCNLTCVTYHNGRTGNLPDERHEIFWQSVISIPLDLGDIINESELGPWDPPISDRYNHTNLQEFFFFKGPGKVTISTVLVKILQQPIKMLGSYDGSLRKGAKIARGMEGPGGGIQGSNGRRQRGLDGCPCRVVRKDTFDPFVDILSPSRHCLLTYWKMKSKEYTLSSYAYTSDLERRLFLYRTRIGLAPAQETSESHNTLVRGTDRILYT